MENTYVIDRTGRNIRFSWEDVLKTSQALQPDLSAGGIWNLDGVASISAFARHIAIHPNTDAVKDRVLDLLAEEFCFTEQHRVDDSHRAVRFCTSWATTQENMDKLCCALEKLLG